MEELIFKIFVIVLSLVLLIVVSIIASEIITHKKYEDGKKFRPRLKYMRQFEDGWLFMDDPEMNKAMQIMHITSECIEFSDDGINGKFHKVWEF